MKPTTDSIAAAATKAAKKGLPPVHKWNPPFCGDLDMRIARDGTWFYEGTPIGRPAMVRLFSTILRKDGDDFFLVTPVEKVGITVEDAPFIGTDVDIDGHGDAQSLTFTTNVGDRTTAGPDAPIRVSIDPNSGAPAPYVLVRDRLEALIDRKTFYRLVEHGTERDIDGKPWFGIMSGGTFFPIQPSADLG